MYNTLVPTDKGGVSRSKTGGSAFWWLMGGICCEGIYFFPVNKTFMAAFVMFSTTFITGPP